MMRQEKVRRYELMDCQECGSLGDVNRAADGPWVLYTEKETTMSQLMSWVGTIGIIVLYTIVICMVYEKIRR